MIIRLTERKADGSLDRIHHEGALDGAQTLDRAQHIYAEFVVILHVGRVDFQQIVELPGNIVTFRDFGDVLDALHEVVRDVLAHPAEFHAAEDEESLAQLRGVQDGGIALDDAGGFQPADPVEDRRGGKMDPLCEFLDADAAVFLEDFQELEVGLVQLMRFHGRGFFCRTGPNPVQKQISSVYFCKFRGFLLNFQLSCLINLRTITLQAETNR